MGRPQRIAPTADDDQRHRVRHLVSVSSGDPLAPFALRPEKSYAFSPGGGAAVGYRVRLGTAVASGDPVGDVAQWPAAVAEFMRLARANRWRVAVLGAGERSRPIWQGHRLRGVAIGRDVVVRHSDFTLQGRRFRNVRQAVQRSHNAGVSVEFWREGDLPDDVKDDLRAIMHGAGREDTRGFSMILGRMFDGSQPDSVVAVARDADKVVVGAHRYLRAGPADLSLDLPIRSRRAPNGVDERLIAETVAWGAEQGVERVSLAFAPFPDLFASRAELGALATLAYGAVHLLDPLIRVEALYRYLRKFHAFDQQRFVMLRWHQIVPIAAALLLLEFRG